jgi:hypothetical protein
MMYTRSSLKALRDRMSKSRRNKSSVPNGKAYTKVFDMDLLYNTLVPIWGIKKFTESIHSSTVTKK